jgi:hypothetical protein
MPAQLGITNITVLGRYVLAIGTSPGSSDNVGCLEIIAGSTPWTASGTIQANPFTSVQDPLNNGWQNITAVRQDTQVPENTITLTSNTARTWAFNTGPFQQVAFNVTAVTGTMPINIETYYQAGGVNLVGANTITGNQSITGALTVTSTSANALAVGANGATNPVLSVNAATGAVASGLSIVGAAAGSGVAVQAISSNATEAVTLDAKGAATITLGGAAAGALGVNVGSATSAVGTVLNVTSSSANALTVGQQGATSPAFLVNANTATSRTGLQITSAAAGSGVALQVISSGANEAATIDAKAAAAITLAGQAASATGVNIGTATSAANCITTVTSSNATALLVGPAGATNPMLTVVSGATFKTGLSITGAAGGSGLALATTSNATNEAVTFDAKGSGLMTLASVSTGGCNVRIPVATVAATGTAIGNAAAVTEGFTYVTGSNNAAAVILPVSAVGKQVTLVNDVYTATLQVFPQVNSAINNLAANAVYNIPNGGKRTFYGATTTLWFTDPQTIV